MAKSYAFLDLETTGLSTETDDIIEVGVVIAENGIVIKRFQSLVKPAKKLSPIITRLTGITDEMLADAPDWPDIGGQLLEILGDLPLVGHNVSFDAGFLQNKLRRHLANPLIDTLELAQIALPGAASYRLESIRALVGLADGTSHRALEDAETAFNVFYKCRDLLFRAGRQVLFEVYGIVKDRDWSLGQVLKSWVEEFSRSFPVTRNDLPVTSAAPEKENGLFKEETGDAKKLRPDIDDLAQILNPEGPFAHKYPQYKFRTEQVEMLNTVVAGFRDARHMVIEAGTGTGKSLAYLLPAIAWSLNGNTKVMIATHTINLQEQLWNKDIPTVREAAGFDFKAALVKGRNNYLCLRRWQTKSKAASSADLKELLFILKIMFWLSSTETGDKSELNIMPNQNIYWAELNSEQDSCLGPACPWYHKNCFVTKARKQAEAADILVANHSLLLADIKVQNKLLPAYDYLIIDEAHHLEETATKQLGWSISMNGLRQAFFHLNRGFGGSVGPGLLNQLKLALKNHADEMGPTAYGVMEQTVNECFETVRTIHETLTEMEEFLNFWCLKLSTGTDDEAYQSIRVKHNHRQGDNWETFAAIKENYQVRTGTLIKQLNKLQAFFEGLSEEQAKFLASLRKDIEFQIQGLQEVNHNLSTFAEGPDEYVFWLEVDKGAKPDARIMCAPVSVSQLLYENLFLTKKSALLTSATISVEGNFDHFTGRVGLSGFPAEKLIKHLFTSPFSYEKQSLLCVIRDIPDPTTVEEKEYSESVTPVIFDIARSFGGKTLVLFTSHRMLRDTYARLQPQLEREGITLLGHKIDGGRSRLTEEFKKSGNAVLFGASSFWEGIDLPGDILKCVIIVRLPFAPPNSPVAEARIEELVKNKKDGFNSYSLPEAVIKMKQGFGRLIRAEDDDGVVVVLDRRIIDRKYGRRFLNSLPAKTHFKGDTPTVLQKINDWVRGERPELIIPNILELSADVEKYLGNFKKKGNRQHSQ